MPRIIARVTALMLVVATLSGCVVEAPGHYHWWGWHHDER